MSSAQQCDGPESQCVSPKILKPYDFNPSKAKVLPLHMRHHCSVKTAEGLESHGFSAAL